MLKYKVLPNSNDRYLIRNDGSLVDLIDGSKSMPCNNNKLYLEWFRGKDYYDLDLLLLIAGEGVTIPPENWDMIEIRKDSNNDMYYNYREPIEHPEHKGYYYIPYVRNCLIARNGDLFSLASLKKLKWYKTKPPKNNVKNITHGYRINSVRGDYGEVVNVKRHRCIAFTFIPYSDNPKNLVVNHIDGVPGNDNVDNLEWCTRAENILHAYRTGLHPNKVVPVLVMTLSTNEVVRYESMTIASEKTGITYGLIYERLHSNNGKGHIDGYALKYDDGSPWRINEIIRDWGRRPVVAFNVFDRKMHIFNDCVEMGEFVGSSNVNHTLFNGSKCPINGYLFAWYDKDLKPWPVFTEAQLMLFKIPRVKSDTGGVLRTRIDNNNKEVLLVENLVEITGYTRNKVMWHVKRGYSDCGKYKYELVKPYPMSS